MPFTTIVKRALLYLQGAYILQKNGGKCQSGTLNHRNGQNDVLITYCIGDSLAKFGFVQACIDNINLSYHGSAQQLCTQGRSEILVRGGCRSCQICLVTTPWSVTFRGLVPNKRGGHT